MGLVPLAEAQKTAMFWIINDEDIKTASHRSETAYGLQSFSSGDWQREADHGVFKIKFGQLVGPEC
jgi:hypothetical protein